MKVEKIYLAVTPDKYELPMFVGSLREVAEWSGRSREHVLKAITRNYRDTQNNCLYRRVVISENVLRFDNSITLHLPEYLPERVTGLSNLLIDFLKKHAVEK